MVVTIRKLNGREAARANGATGWCYTIEMKGEGFQGFGYPTYRATLEALLSFAERSL